MTNEVYWLSPLNNCDVCGGKFNSVMYDAKTSHGPWGNLCQTCFAFEGGRLGTGLGQKYELQKNGRWLKTGG